ncbi:hypothetical protein ACP70R_029999 [Stipagrostis hirtigluma subsp. patula]
MGPKEELSAAKLTDDLVVDILSRLPFKSFCRFKCVCKAWLAFSSDPHYCQKLPKPPTGFFYQDHDTTSIQLVSLSKNDEEIDGTLSFLPDYEQLKFVDCCNGLVLCKYSSNHTSPDIFRFIVCNPATREWRTLPDTKQDPENSAYYSTKLGFDPSRSPHFYVFNFRYRRGPGHLVFGINQIAMFSSCNSTWLVYNDLWDRENYVISVSGRPHVFLDGCLHVHSDHDVLVLDTYETVSTDLRPSYWTVKLPLHEVDCVVDRCFRGCLGQASGILHYAAAEEDGCTIIVWLHDEFDPDGWIV